MRLAIDTLFETPGAGTGGLTYLISLIEAMGRVRGNDEVVVLASSANRRCFEGAEGIEVVEVGSSNESRVRRIWTQQARLDRVARDSGCDVFLGAGNSVPLVGRLPSAVVLHSLMFLTQPGRPDRARASYRKAMVGRSCAKARRIIPVSQFTADVLLAWRPSLAEKTRVVLEGVGSSFTTARRSGIDPYESLRDGGCRIALFASTLWPHKNFDVCVRALAAYRGDVPIRLVVCGGDFKGAQARARELARECGVADRIAFLGHVPQPEMPRMYAWADCFVYPSREEWFGLPLLEAMASGVAVIAARTSCIPEIAGDAALFFDPDDGECLAQEMGEVLSDEVLHDALVEKGLQRAGLFSWDKCARETLSVLREAAGEGGLK